MTLPGRRVQLIHMDTLSPAGWAVTPHASLVGCVQHLSCKHYSADRRKQVILQWRDLTRTTLASISRLIPTVTSAVDSMHLRFARIRMALDLCGLPPKTHDPSLIISKTSDKFQPRDILRNTPQNGHRKHGESEKLAAKTSLGGRDGLMWCRPPAGVSLLCVTGFSARTAWIWGRAEPLGWEVKIAPC